MTSHATVDPRRSHRLLLASVDNYGDSGSEKDVTTDDECGFVAGPSGRADEDAFVGVSMGDAQNRMKSASTPAYEKAQALEESRSYFAEPESYGNDDEERGVSRPNAENGAEKQRATTLPKGDKTTRRSRGSSISKVLLGSSKNIVTRPRATSGGLNILRNLKKIIPGVASSDAESNVDGGKSDSTGKRSSVSRPDNGLVDGRITHRRAESSSEVAPTTSTESEPPVRKSRPRPLRRATSDNSLYLKRTATGASTWDDYSVFAKVSDMPNSRSKAITDSWQDASWKLPRFGSLGTFTSRTPPGGSDEDLVKRNTEANAGKKLNEQSRPVQADSNGANTGEIPGVPKDTRHPILKGSLARAAGDMVLIGGYRGSVLRAAEPPHQQLWAPIKVGVGLRRVDLEVGLTHEDEERMEEKIYADGILSHIGPIDIARRLLRKMNRSPNTASKKLRIHDYGYDWRLSPHLLSRRLIHFLESLPCNQPETPPEARGALVIAHSLGGLITRHAVNQRPELFSGVVYAGVPQNCVNILGPLRNGDDVFLSSKVLTAQVNFTLRTSYALLPEDGRCFINKETGERYDVDFFDAETWDEYRLSPCINAPLPPPRPPVRRRTLIGSSSSNPSTDSKARNDNDGGSSASSSPRPQVLKDKTSEKASEAKASMEEEMGKVHHRPTSPGEPIAESAIGPSMQGSKRGGAGSTIAKDIRNNIATVLGTSTASTTPSTSSSANNSTGGNDISSTANIASNPTTPTTTSTKTNPSTIVTLPKEDCKTYLARTLQEVKLFKSELAHNSTHESSNLYPPCAMIFGKSTPTVYGAKVVSREAIKTSDAYDDLAFAAGDGVVLASAAQLPRGYRCVKGGRVESDRGHVGLLGDLEGIGRCIAAVLEGRSRGIGLGSQQ